MLLKELKSKERWLARHRGVDYAPHGIGILPQNPKFFSTLVRDGSESPRRGLVVAAPTSRPSTASFGSRPVSRQAEQRIAEAQRRAKICGQVGFLSSGGK